MNQFESKARFVRELEDPTIPAEIQLAAVGLKFQDLRNVGNVLDLGAQDCYIEQAARQKGMFNVISADIAFPGRIEHLILNKFQIDAADLQREFPPNSFGLIISRAGPFYKTADRQKIVNMLAIANNLLSPEAKHLIHPPRFGFIERELSLEETQDMNPLRQGAYSVYAAEANKRSRKFLEELGYQFETGTVEGRPEFPDDLQTYLSLSKRIER